MLWRLGVWAPFSSMIVENDIMQVLVDVILYNGAAVPDGQQNKHAHSRTVVSQPVHILSKIVSNRSVLG